MKVLLVDDHELLRKSLARLLATLIEPPVVFEEAENGEKALEKLRDNSFDLMFLDIRMPRMNGTAVCRHLCKSDIKTSIIVLTQLDDARLISQLLLLGVKSFLTKDCSIAEIELAIKSVRNGLVYLPENLCTSTEALAKKNQEIYLHDLSIQELRLIKFLQQGLTSKDIAGEMNLTVKTIDTYRERILHKTKTSNVAELISFAFKTGLIT